MIRPMGFLLQYGEILCALWQLVMWITSCFSPGDTGKPSPNLFYCSSFVTPAKPTKNTTKKQGQAIAKCTKTANRKS